MLSKSGTHMGSLDISGWQSKPEHVYHFRVQMEGHDIHVVHGLRTAHAWRTMSTGRWGRGRGRVGIEGSDARCPRRPKNEEPCPAPATFSPEPRDYQRKDSRAPQHLPHKCGPAPQHLPHKCAPPPDPPSVVSPSNEAHRPPAPATRVCPPSRPPLGGEPQQ